MVGGEYACILADPPWQQTVSGKYAKHKAAEKIPYPTMTLDEIMSLPVGDLGCEGSHLWLWTTNQFMESGFSVMRAWGFKYLAPIHAVKPSGIGNYFVHRTQTLLFGYRGRCRFPLARYRPNLIHVGVPKRHSQKWDETYDYIEAISPGPRVELFARRRREGWHVWGNEVESDISMEARMLNKHDSEASNYAKKLCSEAARKQGSGGASPPLPTPNVKTETGNPQSHDYLQYGKPLQETEAPKTYEV